MKMRNDFNDSETEVIKMICKLKQIKVREDDQKLLLNSDVIRKKFNELKKLVQKKEKSKKSNKVIQSVKEGNNMRAKLIKKLKEEACRAVKKIIAAKSTDREDKLSDDDNLKNPASTSKGLKNRSEFTRFAIST